MKTTARERSEKRTAARFSFDKTAAAFASLLVLLALGCGRSDDDSGRIEATTPTQAASQLEQAFANASANAQTSAKAASEAMRSGDYEKAVVSLQAAKSGQQVTLEQGIAIHSSVISLESRLIEAIEAGDPNAQRAYDLLKRMKRD